MISEVDDIVKKYNLFDEIIAEYERKKVIPYKVSLESDIYRKKIKERIWKISNSCEQNKELEIYELEYCISLINEREIELYDYSID